MPTLQNNYCARLSALTLLALGMAQFPLPAWSGVVVELRGIDDEQGMRSNVLAYLSFERYKNSDALSPEFVERHTPSVEPTSSTPGSNVDCVSEWMDELRSSLLSFHVLPESVERKNPPGPL